MRAKIIFLLLIFSVEASAESYLCVAESAAGFSYNKNTKEWNEESFDVRDNKYLLSRSERFVWEGKRIGNKSPSIRCRSDFSEFGNLICKGIIQFRMNKNTLRYLITYSVGYWDADNSDEYSQDGADTPYMEIGKCSAIN